ncbi:hypothetical protein [Stakelama tenebrarum]|uniref:SpoVT-AbrB domain-containing protein n=1 Tax=Stakelama tenebrarum TaxID=2711215 RepID=A0A6G6Y6Z8_9SPHN|nr:hypothetical protein [Sphingosinithalassobacter tenebrarum]QIG80353.1 hypothetical protein G5C33_11575 [Sphingosinithalassobacter tenebrarum]
MFHGSALCEVDGDGNVALPGFVAEALRGSPDSGQLIVARHETDPCLVGYGQNHLRTLRRRTERRRIADERVGRDPRGHHRRVRRSFGLVEPLARQSDRAQLPAAMRHLGRIGARALFVGAGDNFEIWNPDLALESEDETLREITAWQIQASGADMANGGH